MPQLQCLRADQRLLLLLLLLLSVGVQERLQSLAGPLLLLVAAAALQGYLWAQHTTPGQPQKQLANSHMYQQLTQLTPDTDSHPSQSVT
jgi:hypothetical protein